MERKVRQLEWEVQQLTQRVELLRKQVQQWKHNLILNRQLHDQLLNEHRQEREELSNISDSYEWTTLILRQAEEFTGLSFKYSSYLNSLRIRQRQEWIELERQLE